MGWERRHRKCQSITSQHLYPVFSLFLFISYFSPSIAPTKPCCSIVDDADTDLPPNTSGEILVKGPNVFRGYHNNPAATSSSFTSGWFRTGDVGLITPAGLLHIVDRKKELIKYHGYQVAPAELEALLLSHPLIADAAVIGVPIEEKGQGELSDEVPRAYVVAQRSKVSEEDVKRYVEQNTARYKWLRGGVVFVDSIPKSPAGKILRKELRILARKERGSKL